MKQEWNESTWIIKGILIFFSVRGILFLITVSYALVNLLKIDYPDMWDLFVNIINENNIYVTSMVAGISLWIFRLAGIYFSFLLLKKKNSARNILEKLTWVIVLFGLFYFIFPQFLGVSHTSIFSKEAEYFSSPNFIFGGLIIFGDVLVLIGLRNKSTIEYVRSCPKSS